jgi:hypothetical protein
MTFREKKKPYQNNSMVFSHEVLSRVVSATADSFGVALLNWTLELQLFIGRMLPTKSVTIRNGGQALGAVSERWAHPRLQGLTAGVGPQDVADGAIQ